MGKKSKAIVIIEPDEELPKDVYLCRWSRPGPGYHPGQCSTVVKGKVYCTADFPHEIAVGFLRRSGVVVK